MTSSRLPRPAWLAVTGAKLAVVVSIGVLGAVGGDPVPREYVGEHAAEHLDGRTGRLLDAHDCSTTGFGTEVQPRSAVIRSAAGKLRFVDFDTGWRVYTERGAATLVGVCLDEPPA